MRRLSTGAWRQAWYRPWVWRKAERSSLARFVSADCAVEAAESALPGGLRRTAGPSYQDLIDNGDRRAVAAALYDRMAEIGIDYHVDGYTSDGDHSQRIRSPIELVQRRVGTCLDLALFYAGLALDTGLRPVIIVLEGHALTAVIDVEFELQITDTTPVEVIAGWIESGQLIPVECTGATTGRDLGYDFDRAVEEGAARLGRFPFLFAIDPARLQKQSGLDPFPCRRLSPVRMAIGTGAAVVVAALTILGGLSWYRSTRVPVFDTQVEGVAVTTFVDVDGESPDETGLGDWLARSLSIAAEEGGSDSGFLGSGDCPVSLNTVAVWDPATSAKAPLDDFTNPSNVDVIMEGRVVDRPTADTAMVELSIVPFDASVRSAADPVALVALPSIPTLIDQENTAFDSFPELKTLPAIIRGLRRLDSGTDLGLEQAECLFELVDETVFATGDTRRNRRFLASVDLLRANVLVRQASGAPADVEAQALLRASAAIDQAEDRLDDPSARAILDANRIAIDMLGLISDDGSLEPGVSMSDVTDAITRYGTVSDTVADVSDSAYIAVNVMTAKLALAGWRGAGQEPQLLEVAEQALTLALDRADRITDDTADPAIRRHAADAYWTRGLVDMVSGDPSAAVERYSDAAQLTEGTAHYRARLAEAGARAARCVDGDAAAIAEILTRVERYVDSTGDGELDALRSQTEAVTSSCSA